jgi:hypothetical protein
VTSQRLYRDALIEGDHRQSEVGEVPQAWRMTNVDRRLDGGDQRGVGQAPKSAIHAGPATHASEPLKDALGEERQPR